MKTYKNARELAAGFLVGLVIALAVVGASTLLRSCSEVAIVFKADHSVDEKVTPDSSDDTDEWSIMEHLKHGATGV